MKRRKFTDEFKRSAVALIVDQKYTRQQAAESLDVGLGSLDNWLKKDRLSHAAENASGEIDLNKRVAELERDCRRLTMERDILKKAAAYFAKDNW